MTGRWALEEGTLSAMLRDRGVPVGERSPFAVLPDPPAGAAPAETPSAELLEALGWVARPRLEVGLLLSPPHGLDVLWFYLGDQDRGAALVGHLRDAGRRHCLAWTSDGELLAQLRSCLDLEAPVGARGSSFSFSSAGYTAFLAVLDANREWTLQSLLDRLPQPRRAFTPEGLAATLGASLRSEDPRWLSVVAWLVSPLDLSPTPEECRAGLEELARAGLVQEGSEGWALTPEMQRIAAVLASPVAYASVHARLRVGDGGWRRRHLAALRGLGSLWLVEFPALDASGGEVLLAEVAGADLEARVADALREWRRESVGGRPPAARTCAGCGAGLAFDARFCSRCGARVADEPPPALFCRGCGVPRRAGHLFCTGCGQAY